MSNSTTGWSLYRINMVENDTIRQHKAISIVGDSVFLLTASKTLQIQAQIARFLIHDTKYTNSWRAIQAQIWAEGVVKGKRTAHKSDRHIISSTAVVDISCQREEGGSYENEAQLLSHK